MAWWGAHQWLMCHMAYKQYITLMASDIHFMGGHWSILYESLGVPFSTQQKSSKLLNQRWSRTCWMNFFIYSLVSGHSWTTGACLASYVIQFMFSNFVSFHTSHASGCPTTYIGSRILGFRVSSGGAFVLLELLFCNCLLWLFFFHAYNLVGWGKQLLLLFHISWYTICIGIASSMHIG